MTNLFKTGILLIVFLLVGKLMQAGGVNVLTPVPATSIKVTASSEFRGAEAVFVGVACVGAGLGFCACASARCKINTDKTILKINFFIFMAFLCG